ncbi:hypothetical protein [Actinoallomurus sp. CA-150999]
MLEDLANTEISEANFDVEELSPALKKALGAKGQRGSHYAFV